MRPVYSAWRAFALGLLVILSPVLSTLSAQTNTAVVAGVVLDQSEKLLPTPP